MTDRALSVLYPRMGNSERGILAEVLVGEEA